VVFSRGFVQNFICIFVCAIYMSHSSQSSWFDSHNNI
jgi:hypothetical protein